MGASRKPPSFLPLSDTASCVVLLVRSAPMHFLHSSSSITAGSVVMAGATMGLRSAAPLELEPAAALALHTDSRSQSIVTS